MTVTELSAYLEQDFVFSRGETPAFRVDFTGVTADEVAGWEISAPVHRDHRAAPVGAFEVTVIGTSVTFTLSAGVTEVLPDHARYSVRLASGPNTVRVPMGGRLLVRSTPCR